MDILSMDTVMFSVDLGSFQAIHTDLFHAMSDVRYFVNFLYNGGQKRILQNIFHDTKFPLNGFNQ